MMTSEQETSINFMRDSDECSIYTSDTLMMAKFDKLVARSDKWTLVNVSYVKDTDEVVGKTYKTSKKLIKFIADKRQMTDEQKEVLKKRMDEINERRKSQNQI